MTGPTGLVGSLQRPRRFHQLRQLRLPRTGFATLYPERSAGRRHPGEVCGALPSV